MSYSQDLNKALNNATEKIVRVFIVKLCSEYSLDEKKVLDLWLGVGKPNNSAVSETKDTVEAVKEVATVSLVSSSELTNLSKKELVDKCKDMGLPISGTKLDLIKRIQNPKESKTTSLQQTTLQMKSKKTEDNEPTILKQIKQNNNNINIIKNTFGNLIHEETQFVFDNKQVAIGKQEVGGKVKELNKADLLLCKEYEFKFKTPMNLNNTTTEIIDNSDNDDDEVLSSVAADDLDHEADQTQEECDVIIAPELEDDEGHESIEELELEEEEIDNDYDGNCDDDDDDY